MDSAYLPNPSKCETIGVCEPGRRRPGWISANAIGNGHSTRLEEAAGNARKNDRGVGAHCLSSGHATGGGASRRQMVGRKQVCRPAVQLALAGGEMGVGGEIDFPTCGSSPRSARQRSRHQSRAAAQQGRSRVRKAPPQVKGVFERF